MALDETKRKHALAREKRWVEDKFIEEFESSLMELAKLYLWQDDINNRNHWKQNVWACCRKTYRYGGGVGSFLSEDALYNLYVDTCGICPDSILRMAMYQENNRIDITQDMIDEFSRIQDAYAAWACSEYSQYGDIDNQKIYREIDQLFGW